ncbi:hypothetical protein D3C81_1748500 [compost metagenome]
MLSRTRNWALVPAAVFFSAPVSLSTLTIGSQCTVVLAAVQLASLMVNLVFWAQLPTVGRALTPIVGRTTLI